MNWTKQPEMTDRREILADLGILANFDDRHPLVAYSPIDSGVIGRVATLPDDEVGECVRRSVAAFQRWRQVPAPRRGELVRLLGGELREHKEALGRLVTLETGKILQEGLGEVQEMIDICDLAVGLSRQLHGLTIASERPGHALRESWHPLGPTVVITAFNFPVAVWSWNAALALVCGNSIIWKPSEKTPLTALAVQGLLGRAIQEFGSEAPVGLSQTVLGGSEVGAALAADSDVRLVSATGSTAMGRAVGEVVAKRFGRSILELGGNNAMIVSQSADIDLAVSATVFAAVGTAGQRCTTLRRLIVHQDRYDEVLSRLQAAYSCLPIGDPFDPETLVGPLIDSGARRNMDSAMEGAVTEGGRVFGGERVPIEEYPNGIYVRPALIEMPSQTPIVCEETFAPILYVLRYRHFRDAIAINNAVAHGLSSSLITENLREAELFTSSSGSDCGLANVNAGPSGAEIGGAFGGEKQTGGGRESGSDSWKGYMRRQTNTINFSDSLTLAQGITFGTEAPK